MSLYRPHRLPYLLIPTLFTLLLACDSQPAVTAEPAEPVAPPAATATLNPADLKTPALNTAETDRHYRSALELETAGRLPEARAEVELALAGGAGRDARLLAAKLAILRNDLDGAAVLLAPLADRGDALVLYNLGLIAQRRGDYNPARNQYLAALKADPSYAPARYNLALLTWEAGIKDEARHHASKFLELSPGDPRGAGLRARVELGAGAIVPASQG